MPMVTFGSTVDLLRGDLRPRKSWHFWSASPHESSDFAGNSGHIGRHSASRSYFLWAWLFLPKSPKSFEFCAFPHVRASA